MKFLVRKIERLQLAIGTLCLSIFLITVLIQIFTRYLKIPAVWTEDVAMYSFIWSVFMGGGAMVYTKKHFAFTSLGDKLQGKSKNILSIMISLIMMVFTLAMLKYGLDIVKIFWNHHWISMPKIKMGYTWMCIPITGITTTLYLISHIAEDMIFIVKGGDSQ